MSQEHLTHDPVPEFGNKSMKMLTREGDRELTEPALFHLISRRPSAAIPGTRPASHLPPHREKNPHATYTTPNQARIPSLPVFLQATPLRVNQTRRLGTAIPTEVTTAVDSHSEPSRVVNLFTHHAGIQRSIPLLRMQCYSLLGSNLRIWFLHTVIWPHHHIPPARLGWIYCAAHHGDSHNNLPGPRRLDTPGRYAPLD